MSTTPTRKPRPHPARRARKITGSLSVATMLALTGFMVGTTTIGSQTASVATSAAATPTTPTTASRSTSATAVAASASTQSVTSTHGS